MCTLNICYIGKQLFKNTKDLFRKQGASLWLRCKESACNAGDPGLMPGLERFPREGNGNPLQSSCLENSMDEETGRLHCSENKGSLIIFSPVKEIQGIGENCWGKSCLLLLFQENLNNAALNISSGVKPHAYVLLPPRV